MTEPHGWTAGEVLAALTVDAAFEDVPFGFADTVDAAGNEWPEPSGEWSFGVGVDPWWLAARPDQEDTPEPR